MKAVVLVGGMGTRLRPLTFSIPKPLLPVGETPLLQFIIERLAACGIDEVVLATGYQAELIHAFCGDGTRFGVRIDYVHEEQPLGTAGPLSLVRDRVADDEHFVLMNGDVLTTLDFRNLFDFAARNDHDLTIAYTKYVYESPFGVLNIVDGSVVDIVEKPAVDYSISAGIYVIRGSVLGHVPEGFFTMPQLTEVLLAGGRSVGAFYLDEFWLGLETVARFEDAVEELQRVSSAMRGEPSGQAG